MMSSMVMVNQDDMASHPILDVELELSKLATEGDKEEFLLAKISVS